MEKKLEQILDELIIDGFPELMNTNIQIKYTTSKTTPFAYDDLNTGSKGFYIEVSKYIKDAPKNVLYGGLAHELSHIISELPLSKKEISKDREYYNNSFAYRKLDERNTDVTVILRGYGKELLALLKYLKNNGYEHCEDGGLSVREVKKLLSII